jgi:hypothetical protein
MTERQFIWWLRGYIGQDTQKLGENELKLIKSQLKRVGEKPERSEQQKVDAFSVYS